MNPAALSFRDARPEDLAGILALIAEDGFDPLHAPDPLDPHFAAALAEIDADPNNRLIVVWRDGAAIGAFQLTVIPGVSLRARRRLQIETVRVRQDCRGAGIGTAMIRWAAGFAREAGCDLVQLTTSRARDGRARRFYERLGFEASHDGMKLWLP